MSNHNVNKVQYGFYLDRIDEKRNYVQDVLNAKFEFIQKTLTKEEKDFIQRNCK